MSSVVPEFFLWDQSLNSSCGGRMECETLYELGPPPDMILNIPPPPIPPFMEEFVARLAAEGINIHEDDNGFPEEEKSCNLCQWANGNGVGFVELAQKGPLIDDTWFLVIISSCVAATLLGIILAIAFLKYREGKLKPLSDVALAKKEKALGLERCEAVLYPAPAITPTPVPQLDNRTSRALWAGIKPLEGNHYTVDHCQPMEQKPVRLDLLPPHDNTYDYADYSSVSYASASYTTLTPRLDGSSPRPQPAASFENVGYVPGDEGAEVERIAPDGCVVTAPRAARLLGSPRFVQGIQDHHHYEMVTPSMRRHKSLERGARQPPVISGPTSLGPVRMPPLNGRPRYNLTAYASGTHTLTPKVDNSARAERRHAHVSLDRSGSANTTLAPASPTDHIYASPITSPVI
ncbi:uncharacterized protein LOC125027422 [Penaeus chinensis]|uniref:uncharacterized protein LOC125027422 n=1 Tax=Penaeus chinensis TaxID=139456 RepID=UPI001FB72492|nr:uncharacterized protein LOC125027422 [Penaeus chinensis]XP_047472453.1 uncharacterized protein LOC125027422 [Penaeus chinensis]